jgi:hypothetical protein
MPNAKNMAAFRVTIEKIGSTLDVLKPVKTYKSLDILNQTSEKFY